MAPKTINFPSTLESPEVGWPWPYIHTQGYPLVYTRSKWSTAWVLNARLIPTEITWSVAPTLPVATFDFHYGEVFLPTDSQFQEVRKAWGADLVGSFVKVVYHSDIVSENGTALSPEYASRSWYGVISEAHDELGGVSNSTGKASGKLTIVAYGMEKLLADHAIVESFAEDKDGFGVTVGIPFDFNRQGPRSIVGNRSADKIGKSYVFGAKPSTNQTWSSRDILEYLIQYQTPTNETAAKAVLFDLKMPPGIPTDKDSPTIKTENATTYSIISQILDRRRVTMWWVEVDEATNTCQIKADSMVATPVVGDKLSIPANTKQINLKFDNDQLTNVVINNSELPTVNQVVAQGPRIRCAGTFCYHEENIEAGWTSKQEEAYEAGGSPHPANTPTKRKQTRNDAARRSPMLENVYSLFQIPESWNQKVGDGLGSFFPLFVDADKDDKPQKMQCFSELFIEQSLPLLEGVDYTWSKILAGAVPLTFGNNEEMRPFVMFRKPWTTSPIRYQNAEGSVAVVETTNAKENPRLSCYVTIPQMTRSIRLKVQGEPQHAIAFSDFSGQAEDPKVGEFDWKNAYFTISFESQFRTEGKWPEVLSPNDAIRRKYIYGGDQFYMHYVAPSTVVGIDADGVLQVSAGGHIPALGGDLDPRKPLKDIAKIAAAWYTVEHFVLSIDSYRLKPAGDIPLGALIIEAGGGGVANPIDSSDPGHLQTVNAPVTQITFFLPSTPGDVQQPARMKIKTWAGELDAMEFAGVKPPVLRGRSKRGTAGRIAAAEAVTEG